MAISGASLSQLHTLWVPAGHRLRQIDMQTLMITTLAGNVASAIAGTAGQGDGGPVSSWVHSGSCALSFATEHRNTTTHHPTPCDPTHMHPYSQVFVEPAVCDCCCAVRVYAFLRPPRHG